MESSSSLSLVSTNAGVDSSAVRETMTERGPRAGRNFDFDGSSDCPWKIPKLKDLRLKLVNCSQKLPFKELDDLVMFLETTLQECQKSRPTKHASSVIENFKAHFHEWQSGHRVARMANHKFGMVVACSMSANEAVLQRTNMLSIIDRSYIHDVFSFNCEGQWKIAPRHRLQSTGRTEYVSLPKPDLANFFRLDALTSQGLFYGNPTLRRLLGAYVPMAARIGAVLSFSWKLSAVQTTSKRPFEQTSTVPVKHSTTFSNGSP